MNKTKIMTAVISAAMSAALLTGCGTADTTSSTTGTNMTESTTAVSASAAAAESVEVSFDSTDYAFDWKSGTSTKLDISTGSQQISTSGVYEITGTLTDGSLTVDVSGSGVVFLVLNNTSITSTTSAPIYIKNAEKVVLLLEEGTTNMLVQGSAVSVNEDSEPSAALLSKTDLTITGSGTLSVTSDYNDGITCKDTLKITDGLLDISAVGDGVVGKDLLAVESADITVTAGKDGLRATNETDAGLGNILIEDGTFTIKASNDAIQASGLLQLEGGIYDLSSGDGYTGVIKSNSGAGFGGKGSMGAPQTQTADTATETTADASTESDSKKCLKGGNGILISGGTYTLSAYEDAVHSNGSVAISGGSFTIDAGDQGIQADGDVAVSNGTVFIENSYEAIEGKNITVSSGELTLTSSDDGFNVNDGSGILTISGGEIILNAGGDGLDSNGSVTMTGGTVYVDGPTDNGNGAVDYTTGFTISGGTLVAAGSSGMAETPDTSSSQPSILMYYTSTQAAGTTVTVKDESGNVVASYTPTKEYTSAAISAPGLKTGGTYTLYSGSTAVVTFTLSDTVTYLNESGVTTNQGMMGGGMKHSGSGGQKPAAGQMPSDAMSGATSSN